MDGAEPLSDLERSLLVRLLLILLIDKQDDLAFGLLRKLEGVDTRVWVQKH